MASPERVPEGGVSGFSRESLWREGRVALKRGCVEGGESCFSREGLWKEGRVASQERVWREKRRQLVHSSRHPKGVKRASPKWVCGGRRERESRSSTDPLWREERVCLTHRATPSHQRHLSAAPVETGCQKRSGFAVPGPLRLEEGL